jgi:predicted membrane protein
MMNASMTEKPRTAAVPSTKLIVGIFFTLVGVLMTLDNLDLVDADRYLQFWPLVIIAIGFLKLWDRRSRTFAVITVAAGAVLLMFNTGFVRVSILDLWPVILILIGLAIVARAFGLPTSFKISDPDAPDTVPRPVPASDRETPSTIWGVFGVRKEAITTRNYAGNRIFAFLGGCKLDLSRADIEQGSAEIDVVVSWGGVEIRVPEGWEVVGNIVPIMGGADIRTKAAPGGRRLIVNGTVIMGGIEIKSVAAEAV